MQYIHSLELPVHDKLPSVGEDRMFAASDVDDAELPVHDQLPSVEEARMLAASYVDESKKRASKLMSPRTLEIPSSHRVSNALQRTSEAFPPSRKVHCCYTYLIVVHVVFAMNVLFLILFLNKTRC